MEPLLTLVIVTALLRVAGAAGVTPLRDWRRALAGGLAAMFTLTGAAHFVGLREELIAMVPPALPHPDLLVTITGVLELAGAAGLLYRRTTGWAAAGLTALLVVMFPANIYAELSDGGATALLVRTLIQVVFLAATAAVLRPFLPGRSQVDASPRRDAAVPR